MTAVLLALWLAHVPPEITGDGTCPTVTEVRSRLAALAASDGPDAAEPAVLHRVHLSSTDQAAHVELLAADGSLLADRTFARVGRVGECGDLAEAVAVVVSTWEANFNPRLTTPEVHPPSPIRQDPAPVPVTAAKTEPQLKRPVAFDVGLGLLASIVGGEVVSGAKLDGGWRPGGGSMGLRCMLSVTSTHAQPVTVADSGAAWMRGALSAGPNLRLGRDTTMLDFHASGVLALLHLRGTGLWQNTSNTSAQLGVAAGVRGVWAWSNAAAWISADLFAYPGQDHLVIDNYGDAGQLSHWEAQIALGVSLGQFH